MEVTSQFSAAQLKVDCDPELLREELRALGESDFAPQRAYYGNNKGPGKVTTPGWLVLPLRSPGGNEDRVDPGGAGLLDYAETRWASVAPYMMSIVNSLPTKIRSARLLALNPGASVDEHRDYPYGLPAGWVRLHVPVVTNDGAVLVIDGQKHTWQPGTMWYGNFSQPHYVHNNGDARRVHLVIDVYVNRDLLELFPDEFVSRIRWSEVILNRPVVPLAADEVAGFESTFDIPETFAWGGDLDDLEKADPKVREARLSRTGGELILEVDGEPQCRLVHIGEGEFRFAGYTAIRTIKLDLKSERIRFRMRYGSNLKEFVGPVTALVTPHGSG
jgi:aspartate beta-hydroxylase